MAAMVLTLALFRMISSVREYSIFSFVKCEEMKKKKRRSEACYL